MCPMSPKESPGSRIFPSRASCIAAATTPAGAAPSVVIARAAGVWPPGLFMISACIVGVLLEHPISPLHQSLEDPLIRRLIAGIAMGLVTREGRYAILTDIQGVEDALGDMNF